MSRAQRATVLISGSGTNLQALIDACQSGRLSTVIVHVISNVSSAVGLERARRAGISVSVLEYAGFERREEFDQALAVLIAAGNPDLVILAGFMRIIGEPVLGEFAGRMINLHPSLLPLYPGLNTYQKALDAGDAFHGASIHFVTRELDGGPVIAQVRIPVNRDDSRDDLQERLAPEEHRLIVATVELFERHTVESAKGVVLVDGRPLSEPLKLDQSGSLEPLS